MTSEMFEFVDRDYGQCTRVNPSRQIKTRRLSFDNILDKFNKFRISMLQGKLDKKVEKALTQGYTQENYESKISKNAEIIARLEEKIKVLSKEDVPTDYVARRAIKLRKSMIDNLTYNTGVYYTVGMENYDEVMGAGIENDEVVVSDENDGIPFKPIEEASVNDDALLAAAIPNGNGKIDVVPNNVERQAIVDAVNSSFDDVREDNEAPVISSDDVKDNQSLNNEDAVEEPVIDTESVRKAVDEAFKKLDNEKVDENDSINKNIDDEIDRIRVSRNSAKAVNAEQFDENGNRIRRKKYNYTPMTDEEIREAQIKLGFDEHGNLISNGKRASNVSTASIVGEPKMYSQPKPNISDVFVPVDRDKQVRDIPIVVKDRDESSLGLDLEDGNNMFEIINQDESNIEKEEKPVTRVSDSSNMTIDDYTALKEKILFLQKQRETTQMNKDDAQRRVKESAAREEEARKMYELSQANYNERMKKLRDYAASLEAVCSENEREAAAAEQKVKESEDLALDQQKKADRTNQIIGEIDQMIGETEVEEKVTSLRTVK